MNKELAQYINTLLAEKEREVEKEQKKLFFPLDNVTETCYIYSINETELEKNYKYTNYNFNVFRQNILLHVLL